LFSLFLAVNRLLLKLALSKQLPPGLFLSERLKPSKALHLNLLQSALLNEPSLKLLPHPSWRNFSKKGVVRGKIVKVGYFHEQGLEVFLDKLKA